MRELKLFKILRSLEAGELRRLRKFFASPFFTPNPHHSRLLEALLPHHPHYRGKKLSREALWDTLFPQEPFDEQRLKKMLTEFTHLLEQFLVVQGALQNPLEFNRLLMEGYRRRKTDDLFFKTSGKLQQQLEKMAHRGEVYHLEKHRLHQRVYFSSDKTRDYTHLRLALDALDQYYALSKALIACEAHTRQRIFRESHELELMEELRAFVRRKAFFGTPLHELLYLLLDLFEKLDVAVFEKAIGIFRQGHGTFAPEEKEFVFFVLLNFAISLSQRGHRESVRLGFELYQFGLAEGMLVKNGTLSDATFLNIVSTGVVLGEFDWLESFIKDYQRYLDPALREDVVTAARATILFVRREYSACRDLLLNYNTLNVFYKLRMRGLLLRVFYEEMSQDDSLYFPLVSHSQAFEKFLRRNRRLSENRAGSYLEFVKITRQLAKVTYNNTRSSKTLKRLQAKIETTPTLAYREWLQEKLAELM